MRYQKQELLSYIGNKQELLQKKVVAIVGLGAIGSNTANLLARAGINLILIDRDIVELENLQRQTLYDEKDIGKPKSIQAKKKLKLINSDIKIKAFVEDLNYNNIDELIKSDLILDCSDNMETRFLINDYSIKNEIPWIYAAVLGVNAMSMNIVPQKTPCFRCIFKESNTITENCNSVGVLNTITNLIATIQVNESLKILTNQEFNKTLVLFNIWNLYMQKFKINKNINCEACSNLNFEYLDGKTTKKIVKLCGTNSFQIHGNPINLENLYQRLSKFSDAKINEYCVYSTSLTAFSDGRVLIRAENLNKAKSLYSRFIT